MRQIKLTYLITDLKVGGVPLHLYRLATRLPPSRFQIRVITLADEGPVGARLRAAGIPVLACGARSAGDLRALARLWRYLKAEPPDLLHSLLFHANISARIIGPLTGMPIRRILCEIQTAEVERRWHLWVDGLTCRLCRYEIANSPSVLDHLHCRARIPLSRLQVEWGAVDTSAIVAASPADRGELGIAPGERFVLWTGRLDPVKGFEEILAGFRQLIEHIPAKLVLVGEGAYRSTVERLISENGVVDRVKLLGQRADVPNLLKAADLFILCSRTEGLSNSLLEAMAAGLPIVATDVPGNRDLIRNEETGLLVSPGSADAIAGGMRLLLEDRAKATVLGNAAQDWVVRNLDIEKWARRWEMRYREVLSKELF